MRLLMVTYQPHLSLDETWCGKAYGIDEERMGNVGGDDDDDEGGGFVVDFDQFWSKICTAQMSAHDSFSWVGM